MPLAMYIPSWEGAVLSLMSQIVLNGALFAALLAFSRQYCGALRSALFLSAGLIFGSVIGFVQIIRQAAPNDLSIHLLTYVELGESGFDAASGLLVSWVTLNLISLFPSRGLSSF